MKRFRGFPETEGLTFDAPLKSEGTVPTSLQKKSKDIREEKIKDDSFNYHTKHLGKMAGVHLNRIREKVGGDYARRRWPGFFKKGTKPHCRGAVLEITRRGKVDLGPFS